MYNYIHCSSKYNENPEERIEAIIAVCAKRKYSAPPPKKDQFNQ